MTTQASTRGPDYAGDHGPEIAALDDDPHSLLSALRAQIEVSTMLMRRLGFSDQDIADCTAQANAAIAKATNG